MVCFRVFSFLLYVLDFLHSAIFSFRKGLADLIYKIKRSQYIKQIKCLEILLVIEHLIFKSISLLYQLILIKNGLNRFQKIYRMLNIFVLFRWIHIDKYESRLKGSTWKWRKFTNSSLASFTSGLVVFPESFESARFVLEYFFVVNFVVKEAGEILFDPFEFGLSKKGVTVCIVVAFLADLTCEFHIEKDFNFLVFLFIINFFQLIQRCRAAVIVQENLTQGWWPFLVFTFRSLIFDSLILFFDLIFWLVSIL